MIINHNMSALFAERQLNLNGLMLDKSTEKLSSGSRITRAGDDASGLAVSEKMRSQIRGLHQASTNASNGISFIQTTEGYLQESQDIIQRLRELSVQSANGIYTDEDRMQIQVEVSALVNEVDRIASHAQFNGMNMLTGRFARPAGENVVTASMWLQIGANMDQRLRVFIGTMTSEALGIRQVGTRQIITMSTPDGANRAIGQLDAALKVVNKHRADSWGLSEQARICRKGSRRWGRKHASSRVAYPRHGYGCGDGGVHKERNHHPVRHRDAGAGERQTAIGLTAASVNDISWPGQLEQAWISQGFGVPQFNGYGGRKEKRSY